MQHSRILSAYVIIITMSVLSPISLTAQTRTQPTQTQAGIPANPRDLKFSPLEYTPPKRDKYRHVLSNGAVAYLVEDHDLPLVNVSSLVRTGSYLEPAGKEGIASLTGGQIRA